MHQPVHQARGTSSSPEPALRFLAAMLANKQPLPSTLLLPPPQAHDHWVRTLCLTPNGRVLLSGSGDSSIGMWEVNADGSDARSVCGGRNLSECPLHYPGGGSCLSASALPEGRNLS